MLQISHLLQHDSLLPQHQQDEANTSPLHLHIFSPTWIRLKFCLFTFCRLWLFFPAKVAVAAAAGPGVLDSHLKWIKHFLFALKMTGGLVCAVMLSSSSGKGCSMPHRPDCAWFEAACKIYFCFWKQSLPVVSQSQSGLFKLHLCPPSLLAKWLFCLRSIASIALSYAALFPLGAIS